MEWHIARMQDYALSGRLSRVSESLAGSSEGCGRQKTSGVEGNLGYSKEVSIIRAPHLRRRVGACPLLLHACSSHKRHFALH